MGPLGAYKEHTGFTVNSQVRLSFEAVTTMLKSKLPWKMNAGGQEFEVSDIKVYGTGDLIAVDLFLGEGSTCHIYLTGKLIYDEELPKVKNFDFTAKTKSVLMTSANWILHEPLRALVETGINTLLADTYKIEREKVLSMMKDFRSYPLGDHATFAVNLTSAGPTLQPYMSREELFLPFAIQGRAEIQLH